MPIIQVDNVSMRFNLAQEKTETLKEYTVKLLKHQLFFNEFYALQDVSFSIEPGESVALIGRNGSGKSTMLKLIAGVMYPSKGSVRVNGEIAPLIELGAGFDMELTARENVYLNGAVLGHDRAYMDEHFKNIIDFAELWDFCAVDMVNQRKLFRHDRPLGLLHRYRGAGRHSGLRRNFVGGRLHVPAEMPRPHGTDAFRRYDAAFRQPRHQPGQAALQARYLDRPWPPAWGRPLG